MYVHFSFYNQTSAIMNPKWIHFPGKSLWLLSLCPHTLCPVPSNEGGGAPADLFIFHTLYYLFIHLFIHYWLIDWFNGFFLIISIISCILWFFFFRICHTAVWCKSLKCISKFQCHYLYHYILFDIIFSSKHRLKL